jgi:hypothetical protein
MKNNLKFMMGLLIFFMSLALLTSCESESEGEPVKSNCSEGYKGPTGDIQSDSFCKVAYEYRCNGKDYEADQNCKVYKQLMEDNPGLKACPYCP